MMKWKIPPFERERTHLFADLWSLISDRHFLSLFSSLHISVTGFAFASVSLPTLFSFCSLTFPFPFSRVSFSHCCSFFRLFHCFIHLITAQMQPSAKPPQTNWSQHANAHHNFASQAKFLSSNFLFSLPTHKSPSYQEPPPGTGSQRYAFIATISYSTSNLSYWIWVKLDIIHW